MMLWKKLPILALLIAGCANSAQSELVPLQEIKVYTDEGEVIAKITKPVPVVRIIYVDKTDYVVEVRVDGKRGLVKDGFYKIRKKDTKDG